MSPLLTGKKTIFNKKKNSFCHCVWKLQVRYTWEFSVQLARQPRVTIYVFFLLFMSSSKIVEWNSPAISALVSKKSWKKNPRESFHRITNTPLFSSHTFMIICSQHRNKIKTYFKLVRTSDSFIGSHIASSLKDVTAENPKASVEKGGMILSEVLIHTSYLFAWVLVFLKDKITEAGCA